MKIANIAQGISLFFLVGLISVHAYATEENCKTINYHDGKVYSIESALYKGTHIELPERMAFPPQPGNAELWSVQGKGHHVMVQPNTEAPQGAKTNLTLLTKSNKSYHFVLKRVPFDKAQSCVIIKESNTFLGDVKDASADEDATYQTPCEKERESLQSEILFLEEEIAKERKFSADKVDSVIAKYRSMVYTRYDWSKGSGFKGKNLLNDVWDDGRFTFFRTRPDHRGMLAIKAQINGEEEILEYHVDSDNIYRISGIYPSFILVYGKKNKVKVIRRDKESNGVY